MEMRVRSSKPRIAGARARTDLAPVARRTMPLSTVLIAVCAAWLSWLVHSVHAQRDAVEAIRAVGGAVEYARDQFSETCLDDTRSRVALRWLVSSIGEDYFRRPIRVLWGGSNCEYKISEEQRRRLPQALTRIGLLTQLEHLDLSWTDADDSELTCLTRLSGLKVLDLKFTRINDLRPITRMLQLEELDLSDTPVCDTGLAHLAELTRLRKLRLDETRITDAGLVHLRTLGNLSVLYMSDTAVTDAGLVHLEGLKGLRELNLHFTKVTDRGLVQLQELRQLGYLYLDGTDVTDAGVRRLKAALPRCDVRR
jgi:hypothetical protein